MTDILNNNETVEASVDDRAGGPDARRRTYEWDDPRATAEAAPTMAGVDFLRAIADGALPPPPMARTVGLEIDEVEPGRVVFGAEPAEWLYNPIGSVHGGFVATLLDSALGCAVHSMLPEGTGYTTLELKVNMVRALRADTGRITCEATIVHAGGRVATAEAKVVDRDGKLYAHGSTTCLVLRPEA
jgi:uncharacterized protein (TIGR00369 family)